MLAFDLGQVLDALGPRALASTWRCAGLWCTSKEGRSGARFLEDAEASGRTMLGSELRRAADDVRQVIDGEFAAADEERGAPWALVRAVDSSWWEVFADESAVLDAVRASFQDVRDAPASATQRVLAADVARHA